MRRLISWLFALCLITIALFGGRVWADETDLYPWGVFWFAVPGQKLLSGFPPMAFGDVDDCEDFARAQLAAVTAARGPVRFRCVLLPFREA